MAHGAGERSRRRARVAAAVLWAALAGIGSRGQAAVTVGPEHTFAGASNRSCDICVHPATGQPHVVWETDDGHIHYTSRDGARWRKPVQVPGPSQVGAVHGKFRNGAVTMAFDSKSRLHIVYLTTGPRPSVYHIRQETPGGAWTEPARVHSAKQGALTWVQMAPGRRDELFVTFDQGYRGYRCEFDGRKWLGPAPLIARTSHVHCVTVGPDGEPHVVFKVKRGGYEGYVAARQRDGWTVAQFTHEDGLVDEPTGAFDAAGKLHLLWSRCDGEGHGVTVKYGAYAGEPLAGTTIARGNVHSFARLVFDGGGALCAFLPRRDPPKLVVLEPKAARWSEPIPLGPLRRGYWFLEAAAHGNTVHVVYSNSYGPDRRKKVTYRQIVRTAAAPRTPRPAS